MIKITFGGPPHSGKTVLLNLVRKLLPRDKFVAVEAAPDGEGITGWSAEGDPELIRAVRRKGKFSKEWVDWVVQCTRSSTMPITLVDLGGMMLDEEGKFSPLGKKLTPENERMLRECTHLIVLANPDYAEAVSHWTDEARRLGVKTLAVLESVLKGADDEIFSSGHPLRARITKLERECPPWDSPTAKAVVERILELSCDGQEAELDDGSSRADVNFPALARELGRDWSPDIVPELIKVVSARTAGQPEVKLWGNCPVGWPYHALACNLLEARVRYFDPKIGSYVPLPEIMPQGEGGQLLDWKVEERDDYTFIEFVISGQIIDVFDLPMVRPPIVALGKGVVISGKGPWWLTGAIARSYARAGVAWVAVFTPQESSRVVCGKKWSEFHPGCGPAVVVFKNATTRTLESVVAFKINLPPAREAGGKGS